MDDILAVEVAEGRDISPHITNEPVLDELQTRHRRKRPLLWQHVHPPVMHTDRQFPAIKLVSFILPPSFAGEFSPLCCNSGRLCFLFLAIFVDINVLDAQLCTAPLLIFIVHH